MEIIGWIGAVLFAACGFPQAVECWRKGHSNGLAWGFLGMWLGGEILTLVYIVPKQDWPLIFNYVVNLGFLAVMLRYKLWPRK